MRDSLLAVIAGREQRGFFEVRWSLARGMGQAWFPLADRAGCLALIEKKAAKHDVFIGAVPRTHKDGGKKAVRRAWCVWVDCDTPEAVERLAEFEPRPALLIRSGSDGNVHAWWPLTTPVSPQWCERANKRLALRLGADVRATDVARILRPPGSLNHKTSPPRRVYAVDGLGASVPIAHLVADLPDPELPRAPAAPVSRKPRLPSHGHDELGDVPVHEYVYRLTGREPDGRGMLCCPFHKNGTETSPSFKCYANTRTWYCWACGTGGGVYEFGAQVFNLGTRGDDFLDLREHLLRALA
jgi:hypothetical protein